MRYIKKLITVLGIIAIIFLALNWQYFYAQIKYYLNPPQVTETNKPEAETAEANKIWIDSLGIQAPIVYVEERSEEAFQVGLRDGVVHYPGTAMPGESGNVYIFGHSSDFPTAPGSYKTVFALLPKIEIGSTVEITDKDGKLFRYKVEEKFVANNNDLHLLEQDYSKKKLSIQTSYPIGTALKRFIVIAYLIE